MTPSVAVSKTSRVAPFIGAGLVLGALLYVATRALNLFIAGLASPASFGALQLQDTGPVDLTTLANSVLLAPVIEEYVFRRKIVEVAARRMSAPWAWALSAALFSAAHAPYAAVHLFIDTLLLAAVCQACYVRTAHLVAAVACHASYNLMILLPKHSIGDLFEVLGVRSETTQLTALLAVMLVVSAVICLVLIRSTASQVN